VSVLQKGGISSKATVTRLRYPTAGTYVDGVYTPPTAVETVIYASVQPPNRLGSTRLLQEIGGQRLQDVICVITQPETLRTLDEATGIRADRIQYLGKVYEVRQINSWTTGQVNMHDTAFATMVDATGTDYA